MSARSLPIFTQRLLIREMTADDADRIAPMLMHPDVMRFWPRPLTRSEVDTWVDRWIRAYRDDGCGYWIVLARQTREVVGQVGILMLTIDFEADSAHTGCKSLREPSLGYIIDAAHQRRGYAFEAASACIDWAFAAHSDALRITAPIRPENLPSVRLAQRLGFSLPPIENRTIRSGLAHDVWVKPRPG